MIRKPAALKVAEEIVCILNPQASPEETVLRTQLAASLILRAVEMDELNQQNERAA